MTSHSVINRVRDAYARIAEVDRPEIWISLRGEEEVLTDAKSVQERQLAGDKLPLAGMLVAVKDNIDVAGLPTTAGCPTFGAIPKVSAPAIARLVEAGALVLGKTNLDQFATGLVGTRSPHGAVRSARDPEKISGGSSSGSAVAVALGITDLGIGTDTAGSGRVPAALNGIVGIKATLGLVPNTGVVPACRSYDAVTVFASTLSLAQQAIATMTGLDSGDPRGRTWPDAVRLSAGDHPVVAVPRDEDLAPLSEEDRRAFRDTAARLRGAGAELCTVDISDALAAATLLYDGALVAERYAAVGKFIDGHRDAVDPSVGSIISAAADIPAWRHVADLERLDRHRADFATTLRGCDVLLLPTTTEHPRLDEVAAEPIVVNRRLGTYTNFVNLLDLCAVAVPGAEDFGVSIVARAFEDQIALDVAAMLTGEQAPLPYVDTGIDLVVFGAHLRGQPLNTHLVGLGARFAGAVTTAKEYRMVRVPGIPARPGIVHIGPNDGAALPGERWILSPAALGKFLTTLSAPMSLGPITLADGTGVLGFHCDQQTAVSALDITEYGGWLAYLNSPSFGKAQL